MNFQNLKIGSAHQARDRSLSLAPTSEKVFKRDITRGMDMTTKTAYFFSSMVMTVILFVTSRVFAQENRVRSGSSARTTVVPADSTLLEKRSQLAPLKVSTLEGDREDGSTEVFDSKQSSTYERPSMELSQRAASALRLDESNSYSDNLFLREQRRIGLGGSLGGEAGMIGFRAEYNLDETQSGLAALGFGPGYQSFSFSYKRSWYGFFDTEFSPYLSGGYSRWVSRGSGEWSGSDVLKQALTDEQKKSKGFGVDFLPLSAGLQYYLLRGELAGLSFFGEAVLLNQIQPTLQVILSGTLGATFYF
jgi:hypothetical protein